MRHRHLGRSLSIRYLVWLFVVRLCVVLLVAVPSSSFIQTQAQQPPSNLKPEQTAKLQELKTSLEGIKAKLARGDAEGAIKDCDPLLAHPDRAPEFLALRAEVYTVRSHSQYKLGKFLAAVDNAYLGTVEKSDYGPAHRARAEAYLARKQFDKAINACNRAIQILVNDDVAYSLRGVAYGGKGNWDQAIADETKAIELNSGLIDAYQRRASAYIAKKKFPEAAKDLESTLQKQPKHPEALCDRSILLAMNRATDRAIADLDSAIAVDPKCARAYLLKARLLVANEKKDLASSRLASSLFDKAIDCSPCVETYLNRGQYLFATKKYESAVADFSKAIECDRDGTCDKATMYAAYQGRLQSNRKLGNTETEEEDLKKVRDLAPKPPEEKGKKEKEKDKEKDKDKVDPGLARRFLVTSKPVDPNRAPQVKVTAARIDQLVAANYAKHKVVPNDTTSDEQFVRRVYLDVTGTIPSLRQTMIFLKSTDTDKREKLIDELLNSEGYSSHFFNYWVDAIRYKDELNPSVRGEPFRQYLKQSLAENKPWNRLVYELIASQGRVWDTPATGYMQRDPGMPLDVMNNTLRIFLGTRIGCAQCHNHPFDRWTQKEFYQMAAFTFGTHNSTSGAEKKFFSENPVDRLRKEFDGLEQEEEDRRINRFRFDRVIQNNMMVLHDDVERAIRLPKDYAYDDAKPGDVISPKVLFGSAVTLEKGEPPRRVFAKWLVSKENPRFAKTIANRLWKQVFGLGQVEPVDDMTDKSIPENPELFTFLEAEMIRLNFDMKEYLRILLNTKTYQRQAYSEELLPGQPYHFPGPTLRRMTAEQAWDSFVTLAVDNCEYREPKASLKAKVVRFDFKEINAKEVIESEPKGSEVDRINGQFRNKFVYRGELIARASELPSPVPPNHFLRMFGQSDRELIAASSSDGSVPQILFMLNGPVSHMLLENNSTIYNNIMRRSSLTEGIKTAFYTVLNREPDQEELDRAMREVKEKGAAGYGNIVWSLVNTREFLFIQ